MECLDCKKQLKGGFGVGQEPYKEFRCAACVLIKLAEDEQKAKQVADILTGKVYLCKDCGEYHEPVITVYLGGIKLDPLCPKSCAWNFNYEPPFSVDSGGIEWSIVDHGT